LYFKSYNEYTNISHVLLSFYNNHLEWGSEFFTPKCATIQLCDGHSCLIIQLNQLEAYTRTYDRGATWKDIALKSLVNFLSLPNITFVGVGIKENRARLEKHYGIGCKNAVELGPLAATVMNMPRLNLCDVDELAFIVNGFDLQDHSPVSTCYDYAAASLSKELVKVATVNVYSYHKIGAKLVRFSFDSKYHVYASSQFLYTFKCFYW
jgi:hypothetical protein